MPLTAASSPPPTQADLVVIGAGAAGIAAARRLAGTRLSVVVLEARDRIGGRAHTVRQRLTRHREADLDVALDMGCGWLHSADENVLAAMAPRVGLTIDDTPPPWRRTLPGLGLTPAEMAAFSQAFEAFETRLDRAAAEGRDGPASTLFPPPDDPLSRWNPRLDAISGALNGARFAEVSIADYAAYRDTGVNWRVREGYGTLIARLGSDLGGAAVVLDCAVRRIDRSGPHLRLETSRGDVEARAVILTVPTSLIGREAIRIEPPVPALVEAALDAPLGLASKMQMWLDHAEEFPADSQLWGRTDTADTGGYHLRPFGRPMIEGFYGGDLARGLEAEGPDAVFAFAVDELVGLLGSGFRKRLTPAAVTDWGLDPWSQGAYSHCAPGRGDARRRLKAPIEDRLFVAGEATAEAFYGTAHGAWMEGERAAVQALVALGIDPRETGGYEQA